MQYVCTLPSLAFSPLNLSPSFPLFPLLTDSLSYNPSIFVLEWRSNAFHLCASVVGLQGQGLPLFIHSPSLHFNSFPTKPRVWFHSALKSKISLHAGAPSWPEAAGGGRPGPRICAPWILEILGHSEMNQRVN